MKGDRVIGSVASVTRKTPRMPQLKDNRVTAEAMVRSRAWRLGYESYRLGQDPEFITRGDKTLAYEYGRLTAAFLKGRGTSLPRIPPARPTREDLVPAMANALWACVRNK